MLSLPTSANSPARRADADVGDLPIVRIAFTQLLTVAEIKLERGLRKRPLNTIRRDLAAKLLRPVHEAHADHPIARRPKTKPRIHPSMDV